MLGAELKSALGSGVVIKKVVPEEGGIVFVDLDTAGLEAIGRYSGSHMVIALTAHTETSSVMEAMASGAYEVMQRPLNRDQLMRALEEAWAISDEIKSAISVKPVHLAPTCAIVGTSTQIMETCKSLARLSQADVPVLVTGETGTGKELVAEGIAQLSARFGKPFIVVNCAAVPETLLESELFGFERGAFTGAIGAKDGLLKVADGGCVFFDEVGELPISIQGKLLRFLQTQTFYPIGSTREVHVDVRVISATSRDLRSMIRDGLFREDLYHRLHVAEIHVPPLRERKDDISALAHFFVGRYRHTAPREIRGMTEGFMQRLMAHDWPGNIRELENAVRSAIAISRTPVLTSHDLRDMGDRKLSLDAVHAGEALSEAVVRFVRDRIGRGEADILPRLIDEVERAAVGYALEQTRQNRSRAARLLGINRITLRKKTGLTPGKN